MKHTKTAAAAVALVMAMSNVPFTVNVSAEETAPKKTVEEMVNEVTSNNPKYDVKIAKLNIKGDTVELRNEEDGTLLVGKKIGYYDTFVKYNDDDTTSAETIFLPSAIKYMAVDVNGKALLDDYYIPIGAGWDGEDPIMDPPRFGDNGLVLTNGNLAYYNIMTWPAKWYDFIDEKNDTFDQKGWDGFREKNGNKTDQFALTPVFSDMDGKILFDDNYLGAYWMCNGIGPVSKNPTIKIPENKILPADYFDFKNYDKSYWDPETEEWVTSIDEDKLNKYDDFCNKNQCYLINDKGEVVLELPKAFSVLLNGRKPAAYFTSFYQSELIPFFSTVKMGKTIFDNPLEKFDDHTSMEEYISLDGQHDDVFYGDGVGYTQGCGYMDKEGNVVISQDFSQAGMFLGDYAFAKKYIEGKGFKWGYINKKGETVIPFEYDHVWTPNDNTFVCAKYQDVKNEEGIVTGQTLKYGMVNEKNEVIIPFEYENAMWALQGLMPAKKDGKWGLVDTDNKAVIPFVFDDFSGYTGRKFGGTAYGIVDGEIYMMNFVNKTIGDANGDGEINVSDIAVTAAHIKGLKPLNEEQQTAADVNDDGDINVSDIAVLAAHIKGIKAIGK